MHKCRAAHTPCNGTVWNSHMVTRTFMSEVCSCKVSSWLLYYSNRWNARAAHCCVWSTLLPLPFIHRLDVGGLAIAKTGQFHSIFCYILFIFHIRYLQSRATRPIAYPVNNPQCSSVAHFSNSVMSPFVCLIVPDLSLIFQLRSPAEHWRMFEWLHWQSVLLRYEKTIM